MTHDFPTIEEVVAIHDDQIALFGGSPGLRDIEGALESAHHAAADSGTTTTSSRRQRRSWKASP